MYINCCRTDASGNPLFQENGIPPGGSVTITLPFYSPLVTGTIDPHPPLDKNGIPPIPEFIDWWNGGNTNVFVAPTTDLKPPEVLRTHWTADNSGTDINGKPVTPFPTQAHHPNKQSPVLPFRRLRLAYFFRACLDRQLEAAAVGGIHARRGRGGRDQKRQPQ